jgi:hypothetical protein
MGVPTLEVGYTSATTGRGDHEVHKGHVVALEEKIKRFILKAIPIFTVQDCGQRKKERSPPAPSRW